MKYDVVIIGAGPAGIFTAIELIRKGANKKIMMVEKGQPIEKRRCPKSKTNKCVNCKPYCHITTGFSGAGAFSDGKLSLAPRSAVSSPSSSATMWRRRPLNMPTASISSSARTPMLRASDARRKSRR